MSDFDAELRRSFARGDLPEAPATLRVRSARIVASDDDKAGPFRLAGGRWLVVAAAALVLAIGTLLVVSGNPRSTPGPEATATPAPSPAPQSTELATTAPTPSATETVEVDGLRVMTVSELLDARDAGELGSDPAALRGYWSFGSIPHSCVPKDYAVLEIYCHDGEFGITELPEQIWAVSLPAGSATEASGPHLTPFIPEDLSGRDVIGSNPQFVNGQLYPPFPVVVIGHFDDPRAADCEKRVRPLCRDRFVLDRIVRWDWQSVPLPGITPTPTPFPSPWPSGMFEPEACAGDIPYSFVGWTTFEALGIDMRGYGHIWAAVSRDLVERTEEWQDGPGGRYRLFARVVCASPEWMGGGAMVFSEIPGTMETHWEDGSVRPGQPPIVP